MPYGYQPVQQPQFYQQPAAPAPGQAYYSPPQAYQPPPGYQPVQPQGLLTGPPGYGGPQDDGLLVTQTEEPPLLKYARAAQQTGGSNGAKQHMQGCPTCGGVMYVTAKRDGSEHAHCYNCGYQPGVREGHPPTSSAKGTVAPSRQYDPATHFVEAVDPETKQTLIYEPNRRQ